MDKQVTHSSLPLDVKTNLTSELLCTSTLLPFALTFSIPQYRGKFVRLYPKWASRNGILKNKQISNIQFLPDICGPEFSARSLEVHTIAQAEGQTRHHTLTRGMLLVLTTSFKMCPI